MPLARGALAVLVAVLPARWWPRLGPRLPVRTAAGLSGVLTMFLVFSLGIPGFMRYAEGFTAAAQEAVAASDDPFAFPNMLFGPLAPLEFAFGTFLGLVATYLCVTGAVRALTTLSDDPRGDPLLTLLDGILAGAADAVGDGRARWSRARREGRAVPDRLVPGAWAGVEADYVVLAARQKPDWKEGIVVMTPDAWYRLGRPWDMPLREGLRTAYPLTELPAGEVLRHGVEHELPALTEPPATATPRRSETS